MATDLGHRVSFDLSGRVALVTGGGRGLGRAFAVGLAKAGVKVAVTARTDTDVAETVDMIARDGGQALGVPGDVCEADAVGDIVRTAESKLGPLDILVNNAGLTGPVGYDWNVDAEGWWRTFEVNVRGAFLCARAVLGTGPHDPPLGAGARGRGDSVNCRDD